MSFIKYCPNQSFSRTVIGFLNFDFSKIRSSKALLLVVVLGLFPVFGFELVSPDPKLGWQEGYQIVLSGLTEAELNEDVLVAMTYLMPKAAEEIGFTSGSEPGLRWSKTVNFRQGNSEFGFFHDSESGESRVMVGPSLGPGKYKLIIKTSLNDLEEEVDFNRFPSIKIFSHTGSTREAKMIRKKLSSELGIPSANIFPILGRFANLRSFNSSYFTAQVGYVETIIMNVKWKINFTNPISTNGVKVGDDEVEIDGDQIPVKGQGSKNIKYFSKDDLVVFENGKWAPLSEIKDSEVRPSGALWIFTVDNYDGKLSEVLGTSRKDGSQYFSARYTNEGTGFENVLFVDHRYKNDTEKGVMPNTKFEPINKKSIDQEMMDTEMKPSALVDFIIGLEELEKDRLLNDLYSDSEHSNKPKLGKTNIQFKTFDFIQSLPYYWKKSLQKQMDQQPSGFISSLGLMQFTPGKTVTNVVRKPILTSEGRSFPHTVIERNFISLTRPKVVIVSQEITDYKEEFVVAALSGKWAPVFNPGN